jgi:hypothetical protein
VRARASVEKREPEMEMMRDGEGDDERDAEGGEEDGKGRRAGGEGRTWFQLRPDDAGE